MIYAVHFSTWVYITMYKGLCDLWKTDFHFSPPKCFMSATLHRMLCCLYKINLFFFTLAISPMSVFFFCFIHCKKKKKKLTAEIPHHQQKVPLKNAAIKWHGQSSQIKYQIIKSGIYNHYSQYFKATESQGSWIGGWTFTSVVAYLCAWQLVM